jgi:hypothetical protein
MSSNKLNNGEETPKKRIEYRGKNVRISRTGGVAATKTIKGDGYGVTRCICIALLQMKLPTIGEIIMLALCITYGYSIVFYVRRILKELS